ncbi:MAG: DUF2760 domain-containing protein [Desulfobacteraceae bacterium]|nr:MAG: DUF2760 domain-containing protein [Desulfobacteraceae bacterium]
MHAFFKDERRNIAMEHVKAFSRPVAVWVGFFNLLTCLLVLGGIYWILQIVSAELRGLMQTAPAAPQIARLAQWSGTALKFFWTALAPAALLFFIFLTFLTWAILRSVFKRRLRVAAAQRPAAAAAASKEDAARQSGDMNKRIFLHLIAVLQKEGRLLDFFSENLAQYNDSQIGAAVRSIHENCKKAIDKYLSPKAVLDQNEGDEISVSHDFDPNALKLVGNVTGRPPFQGVVRHRGWRALKIDMPMLSGQQDPWIIAPAEIEIR